MAEIITIKKLDESIKIIDIIHDCWFDINDITYNQKFSVLEIKFEKEIPNKGIQKGRKKILFKKLLIPIVECFMIIHNVINYELNDSEEVGWYDFNILKFDSEKKKITIFTGVPLDFQIEVDDFKITVEITDKVVRQKESFSII